MQISVNTAVVYQANESATCVGSFLDNTNHQNAAVRGSLKLMINPINLDADELKQLYIITDRPTSQHRNAGCAYLTKTFAESKEIDVLWISTESGHGK